MPVSGCNDVLMAVRVKVFLVQHVVSISKCWPTSDGSCDSPFKLHAPRRVRLRNWQFSPESKSQTVPGILEVPKVPAELPRVAALCVSQVLS